MTTETQKTQIRTDTGYQFQLEADSLAVLVTYPTGIQQRLVRDYSPSLSELLQHTLSLQNSQPHIPLPSPITPEVRSQRLPPLLQEAPALCPPNLPLEDWIHSSLEALGIRPEKKETE